MITSAPACARPSDSGAADAARATGDDRDAIGQVEELADRVGHGVLQLRVDAVLPDRPRLCTRDPPGVSRRCRQRRIGTLDPMDDTDAFDAGDFGTWLDDLQRALRNEQDADVPCGSCTACCTASQFVHIAPDETDTLAHIPSELLFPAPLLPRGQMLLGYDEHGRCPMLGEHGCSIYEHRPRTCRTYDCRVFTATAIEVDDDLIAARAARWRFRVTTPDAAARAHAIEAAATRLADLDDELDDGTVPSSPTQLAVLAVEIHDLFLDRHPGTDEILDAVARWSPVA